MSGNPESIEQKLAEVCKQYLTDARPGDWDHTLRTVNWIKILIEHEGGDPKTLIPAAYLHDIGWSVVLPPDLKGRSIKKEVLDEYLKVHMSEGAKLSRKILTELCLPREKVEGIVHLVSIHDYPGRVKAKDEVLLMEADRLDRFGKIGLKRAKGLVKIQNLQKKFSLDKKKVHIWFRTETAKKTCARLMKEMEEELLPR